MSSTAQWRTLKTEWKVHGGNCSKRLFHTYIRRYCDFCSRVSNAKAMSWPRSSLSSGAVVRGGIYHVNGPALNTRASCQWWPLRTDRIRWAWWAYSGVLQLSAVCLKSELLPERAAWCRARSGSALPQIDYLAEKGTLSEQLRRQRQWHTNTPILMKESIDLARATSARIYAVCADFKLVFVYQRKR